MPPFVGSFGDQFFAVMINMIGTVVGGVLTSTINTLFSALSANVLAPIFKSLAQLLGLPV